MKTQKESIQDTGKNEILLRVAGGSEVRSVSGAIVKNIREGKVVTLIAIGAGAVNQAVKAVCVASGMMAPQGKTLDISPGFSDETIKGEHKTAVRMLLKVTV
jgi:stage V sporulation protein S